MNFITIGGDLRLHYASLSLSRGGHTVRILGTPPTNNPFPTEEDFRFADAWLLPLPLTRGDTVLSEKEGAPTLAALAKEGREGLRVFGGRIPDTFRTALEERGARVTDYYTDPVLTLANAALTAEGAIFEWMRTAREGIVGKRAAVTGFGRIARHLVRLLTAWQVDVTVYARRDTDRTEAQLCGAHALPLSEGTVFSPVDAIFNTVPARILRKESFSSAPAALVFDLADGISHAQGCAALSALRGVPGRYAPKAAGEIIADAILRSLP